MKKKDVIPEYLPSLLNTQMINYICYYPKATEKILYFLLSFFGGGAVSLVFFSGLFKSEGQATMATYISDIIIFVCVGLIVSKVLYKSYVARLKEKRDIKLRNQFRDLLDSLSASYSSGANSNDAFTSANNDMIQQHGANSFIAKEATEIIEGIKQNVSITDSLKNFAERSDNEDIENFANVYGIALEKGSDLKTVIRRTHTIISDRIAVNDEIQTKLASNKLQHTVMSLMPIGIVTILRFTNDSFANSFSSPLGIIVNIIAIIAFIGSYILGRKICNIK